MGGAGSHWRHVVGLKTAEKSYVFKVRLTELTDAEMRIFRGVPDLWSSVTESVTTY